MPGTHSRHYQRGEYSRSSVCKNTFSAKLKGERRAIISWVASAWPTPNDLQQETVQKKQNKKSWNEFYYAKGNALLRSEDENPCVGSLSKIAVMLAWNSGYFAVKSGVKGEENCGNRRVVNGLRSERGAKWSKRTYRASDLGVKFPRT